MPSLAALLNAHDLSFLQALAEGWGLPAAGRDARELARYLAKSMQDPLLLSDVLAALPLASQNALALLRSQGSQMPWSEFTRRFGELRPMGPAKRAREQPYRFPASTTEKLWYLGLIGRDFLRGSAGLVESAYLPSEFVKAIPLPPESPAPTPLQTRANPPTHWQAPILEDSTTLLAALRRKDSAKLAQKAGISPQDQQILAGFLQGLGLLGNDGKSPTAAARPFLEQNRASALTWLVQTWLSSRKVNELRLVPSLRCEGTWANDPLTPRQFLIGRLRSLKAELPLKTFIAEIHETAFDFLRPPVESANWMIATAEEPRQLLRGPASWPGVEGAWLELLLTRLLPWMGLLSLRHESGELMLYKTEAFDALLLGQELTPFFEGDRIKVDPGGAFSISQGLPRIARYQLSRFGDWLDSRDGTYRYQVSAAALEEAAAQGLTVKHFLSLLRKYAKSNPQALVRSLRDWEANGSQIKLQHVQLLRLAKPELLPQLRAGPAGPYLGEALGPDAVVLKPGALPVLRKALLRQGFLAALPEDNLPDG